MSYEVSIIADSVAPHGARITTYKLKYPRFIHQEFLTHRALSRNASSSRAIPLSKMLEWVHVDPAMPIYWGKNKPGMQADEEIDPDVQESAAYAWGEAARHALRHARHLGGYEVHKQIASRILEPFAHINVVATATTGGWMNYFALRCHADAMPEMRHLAVLMARAYRDSPPKQLGMSDWHLPFTDTYAPKVSAARWARVSYLTHDGKPCSVDEDLSLFDRLRSSGHWSPMEHQAYPADNPHDRSANFVGWNQYRQWFEGQNRTEFDFSTLEQWP